MSGLEGLAKLTDLSLFSNEVEDIDGLQACQQLQFLSLGNNRIRHLENVRACLRARRNAAPVTMAVQLIVLRGFEHLRALNLQGNPVCEDAEYRSYVIAFMKHLDYLDYSLVTTKEVRSALSRWGRALIAGA